MKCPCGYVGARDTFVELDTKITMGESRRYGPDDQVDVQLVACPECGTVMARSWKFSKQDSSDHDISEAT